MRHYDVTHITGKPNWADIPKAAIDTYLWSDVRSITPSAQAAWDENNLYIRLEAIEPHILRRFTGTLDEVCKDSCLEFFFCPKDDGRYFNFEANPNGALYVGYGLKGKNRCRLHRENFGEIFQVTPFEIPGGWGLELTVPASFVQIFVPDFALQAGMTLRANFFKCGDETEAEHYMSWNPVEVPRPNFHLPEFFGEIKLVL